MTCLLLNNERESLVYHLRDALLYLRTHLFKFSFHQMINQCLLLCQETKLIRNKFPCRFLFLCHFFHNSASLSSLEHSFSNSVSTVQSYGKKRKDG